MNRHFQPQDADDRRDERLPNRGYGRIDQLEFAAGESNAILVAIDLVDADWLDAMAEQDARFDVSDEAARSRAWQAYRAQLEEGVQLPNPFENAPLFRLEIEARAGDSLLGMESLSLPRAPGVEDQVGRLESEWIELSGFSRDSSDAMHFASLYSGLSSGPVPVYIQGKLPSYHQGRALSDIFSLNHLPEATLEDIGRVLQKVHADLLFVYDVGQGNANAVGSRFVPEVYYDLGAGVYGNTKTTPSGLRFCFTQEPTIILSHWDADHWAGAYATQVGPGFPALSREWIAPLQKVGPVHIAFAHDIVTTGGKLFIWSSATGVVGSATMASGHTAKFTIGSGRDKNGSGIVLVIENRSLEGGPVSWMLTGDCDYRYFVAAMNPAPPVGVVAPHHGADLHTGSVPPAPASGAYSPYWPYHPYRRLVYSFGKDNKHGKTGVRHPTIGGITAHANHGWDHGVWMPAAPGSTSDSGADVLATCEHSPGSARQGVVVGWRAPPWPWNLPCGGLGCSTWIGLS